MKKVTKIYSSQLELTGSLRSYTLACFRSHLCIYNDMVDYYRSNRNINYKDLKFKLKELLLIGEFKSVINEIIHNEIYYMWKKADFRQKLITDIQYLTTISKGYNKNKSFRYNSETMDVAIYGCDEFIKLDKPLPEIEKKQEVYINFSYSGTSNLFEFSVFSISELSPQ